MLILKKNLQALVSRCFQLALVLIPTLEGGLGFLNDLQGSTETLQSVIAPLLSMNHVAPEFLHSWRAVNNPHLQVLFYYLLAGAEGIVGALGAIGLISMLLRFFRSHAEFVAAQAWGRASCCLGILIWGLGFFTIAGDFFLDWQNNDISYLQASGLNYALIMFIPYLLMKAFQYSKD